MTTAPPAPPPMTAVVADDYVEARRLFADALSGSGRFSVVAEAGDGRGALAAVADHLPDLALLDLAMPVAGGLDVIEEINRVSPATRVVVVSGFPGRDLDSMVLARGAAGYVRKRPSIRAVVDEIVVAAGVLEMADSVLSARRRFPSDLTSPRQARRFVDEILGRWECQPAVDTLELILSEVVANAVVHAGSEPDVSVRLLGDRLRVEVSDDSDDLPTPKEVDASVDSGRGVAMMAAEAAAWGVLTRAGGGKTVWFEVPVFGRG